MKEKEWQSGETPYEKLVLRSFFGSIVKRTLFFSYYYGSIRSSPVALCRYTSLQIKDNFRTILYTLWVCVRVFTFRFEGFDTGAFFPCTY